MAQIPDDVDVNLEESMLTLQCSGSVKRKASTSIATSAKRKKPNFLYALGSTLTYFMYANYILLEDHGNWSRSMLRASTTADMKASPSIRTLSATTLHTLTQLLMVALSKAKHKV